MKNESFNKFDEYWRTTLLLVGRLLLIWFAVSYLAGIVFASWLNEIKLGGYKLGFWFAQQGSMYVFIILIFYYAYKMAQIDKEYDVHEN